MPSPRSSISTANPLATMSPDTRTGVYGGDSVVAFSISSASRGMTSAPAGPARAGADGGGPGQDDQPLGVAAHTGGQVVEAEQVLERLGVGGAPLHAVQHGQLAVQQRLVAAGQGGGHGGGGAAPPRLA